MIINRNIITNITWIFIKIVIFYTLQREILIIFLKLRWNIESNIVKSTWVTFFVSSYKPFIVCVYEEVYKTSSATNPAPVCLGTKLYNTYSLGPLAWSWRSLGTSTGNVRNIYRIVPLKLHPPHNQTVLKELLILCCSLLMKDRNLWYYIKFSNRNTNFIHFSYNAQNFTNILARENKNRLILYQNHKTWKIHNNFIFQLGYF